MRDVGHETKTPLIHANQRHLERRQLAGDTQHGTVTTDHNGDIGVVANFCCRHRHRARRGKFTRRFLLKNHAVPVFLQEAEQLGQRRNCAGSTVLAKNGDGLKRRSG